MKAHLNSYRVWTEVEDCHARVIRAETSWDARKHFAAAHDIPVIYVMARRQEEGR